MFRSGTGEMQPANFEGMNEALVERDIDVADVYAMVEFDDMSEPPYSGWSAMVMGNEDGEIVFYTLGYADKDALIKDLRALGINTILEQKP